MKTLFRSLFIAYTVHLAFAQEATVEPFVQGYTKNNQSLMPQLKLNSNDVSNNQILYDIDVFSGRIYQVNHSNGTYIAKRRRDLSQDGMDDGSRGSKIIQFYDRSSDGATHFLLESQHVIGDVIDAKRFDHEFIILTIGNETAPIASSNNPVDTFFYRYRRDQNKWFLYSVTKLDDFTPGTTSEIVSPNEVAFYYIESIEAAKLRKNAKIPAKEQYRAKYILTLQNLMKQSSETSKSVVHFNPNRLVKESMSAMGFWFKQTNIPVPPSETVTLNGKALSDDNIINPPTRKQRELYNKYIKMSEQQQRESREKRYKELNELESLD